MKMIMQEKRKKVDYDYDNDHVHEKEKLLSFRNILKRIIFPDIRNNKTFTVSYYHFLSSNLPLKKKKIVLSCIRMIGQLPPKILMY